MADSLRWARQALALAENGTIDAGPLVFCEDHLVTLWLLSDAALADQVSRRHFGAQEKPGRAQEKPGRAHEKPGRAQEGRNPGPRCRPAAWAATFAIEGTSMAHADGTAIGARRQVTTGERNQPRH